MTRRLQAATMLVALAGLVGCGADDGTDAWLGEVRDSAGITIVLNTSTPVWAEDERWRLEEDLRIGAVSGDPDYEFGSVGTISVDSDGAIYAMDTQAQRVAVYDANGAFVRAIGGPGSGPGEIGASATQAVLASDGSLLVLDLANNRIDRWAPTGEPLPSAPLDVPRTFPLLVRSDRAGTLAAQLQDLGSLMGGTGFSGAMPQTPIVRLHPDGSFGDTLLILPAGDVISGSGGAMRIRFPPRQPWWVLDSEGRIVWGMSDGVRLSVIRDGRVERIFGKPSTPTPLTEDDQRLVVQLFVNSLREMGAPDQAIMGLDGMFEFGDFLPVVSNLVAGPDGTVWVQGVRPLRDLAGASIVSPAGLTLEQMGSPDWEVFDAQGRFLGVVTFPPTLTPRTIVGDVVYGVLTDDLGVQYVARYRIVRPR